MLVAALTIAALMLTTWVVSLALKNASIVDIVWGLGFVLVAWAVRLTADGLDARQNLLVILPTIWGLRLSSYLAWRNHGKGEDYRYKAMRKQWGPRFGLISLVTVFALQGTIMFVVSLPVQLGQQRSTPELGWLAWVGVALFALTTIFALITLPVEFDASARAKVALADLKIINTATPEGQVEAKGVNAVLSAAAWTYIAAFAVSLLQLLYYVSLLTGSRRD